jgi:hypothetical protein
MNKPLMKRREGGRIKSKFKYFSMNTAKTKIGLVHS